MKILLIAVVVIVLLVIYAYWNITRKTNQMARALRAWKERQDEYKRDDWVEVEVEWVGSRRPDIGRTSAIGLDEDAAVLEALLYAQWMFGVRAGQVTRLNHQVTRRKGEAVEPQAKGEGTATSVTESEITETHTVDLESKDLVGAQLSRWNLTNRDFSGADLREAQLQGASLGGANLRHANLSRANLNAAYLGGADLSHADLRFADLRATKLTLADEWAYRLGTRSKGSNLTGANLRGAQFNAHLFEGDAILDGVICPEALVEHAQMVGVGLRRANPCG